MPRGCPGAHHKLITRLLLILNRATGEVNLLTTMLLAPTTAAIRTPSDWHRDPATPSRPPPPDTAGAGSPCSGRPCLCRRRIRDPRAVLVPSIPPSLASSRGLHREIDTGLAALSSASDPHPDAMVIVEFDDDDLLGEEEPTPSRSTLAIVTVSPRCPYIPSSRELWRCPAPRPPPRCLPRWRVAAPPSPPLASWCEASSRRRRLHPVAVAAPWGRPTHGFLHGAGFLGSLRPQAQPRPPPLRSKLPSPLLLRWLVAPPRPPAAGRDPPPPRSYVAASPQRRERRVPIHRPYAGGRVPPPPPPPSVLSRGILGSWPPPRPPPPQPPTVGSGCTRCAASKAPPFASGSTSHRSAAPSLSLGRAWIHGGRQARLCPAGGHGWFY
jgi:hypothetical protein